MRQNTWKYLVGLGGIGVIVWLLFGFFEVQALFTDRTVNEDVPMGQTTSTRMNTSSSASTPTTPQPSVRTSAEPRLVAQGTFQQGDSTYTIRGKATVTEKDGVRTLALTDFDVTNGPDLFVYVVSASDVKNETVKEAVRQERFVNLGTLKGNRGNQTYIIPPEVKLNDLSVISIWCQRFFRNFGATDLNFNP